MSSVQSIAQYMLSQSDHGIINGGICYISDKNFVIIGMLFSFLIPSVLSVVFYGLSAHQIHLLRAGKFLDDSESSYHGLYESNESLVEDGGVSDSNSMSGNEELYITQREQVQLAVVTTIEQTDILSATDTNHS